MIGVTVPMTGAQASYLKTLSEQAHRPQDDEPNLTNSRPPPDSVEAGPHCIAYINAAPSLGREFEAVPHRAGRPWGGIYLLARTRPVRTTGKVSRLGGLAAGALSGRQRGEAAIDFVDIELLRIEVASAPFEQFPVTLVLRVRDGFQELAVAPRPAHAGPVTVHVGKQCCCPFPRRP